MKPAPFTYVRPKNLGDALALLAEGGDGARVIAGGQSLGPMLNLRLAAPAVLVDISRLAELCAIAVTASGVDVGAAVRHVDFEDGRVPDVAAGLLGRTAASIAYRAVRNRGTIGGSLAHADPAGDWAPVLMALGATVAVRGPSATREIAVEDLIVDSLTTCLNPDEVIETVRIPRLSANATWGRAKIAAMPGHFGDSQAVVVRQGPGAAATVVLCGPNLPPGILPSAGALIADATTWDAGLAEKVKEAVEGDLARSGREALLSEDELALHQTSVVRAAREAFT